MSIVGAFLEHASMCLEDSDQAIEFLLSRGVSETQRRKHRIGYVSGDFVVDPAADPDHSDVCKDRQLKSRWCDSCRFTRWSSSWIGEEGEEAGPKIQYPGRRLVGSIVFPLSSYSGTPVGFQVRSLAEKSYDSFLIRRRPEGYFFGLPSALDSIWSRREVYLVEGGFDHLTVERLVAPNVLAITTSAASGAQVRFLRRFVDRVNLCLDLDGAGRKGAASFIEHNGSDFLVRNVLYPRVRDSDKDLNDYWRRVGDDAFRRYFEKHILPNF